MNVTDIMIIGSAVVTVVATPACNTAVHQPVAVRLAGQIDAENAMKLEAMRNSDVRWHGSYLGLWPELVNRELFRLATTRQAVDRVLLCALRDPDRFVVAHVLLGTRHQVERAPADAAAQWQGLQVQLWADGHATYDGNDVIRLQSDWMQALEVDGLTCR